MPKHLNKISSKGRKSIPYVRGFKVPTTQEQANALGFNGDIPKEFDSNTDLFKSIPKCKSIDDWLAQYKEDGQTYSQFLQECPWLSNRKRKYIKQAFHKDGQTLRDKYPDGKVYILPLGQFDHIDFDALIDYTRIFLQLPVKKLPSSELDVRDGKVYICPPKIDSLEKTGIKNTPKRQVDKRKKLLSSRFHRKSYQIQVTSILKWLKDSTPDDALCVIALTPSDLYEDVTDLFVAGMAAGNHRVAVFSLYRLTLLELLF